MFWWCVSWLAEHLVFNERLEMVEEVTSLLQVDIFRYDEGEGDGADISIDHS